MANNPENSKIPKNPVRGALGSIAPEVQSSLLLLKFPGCFSENVHGYPVQRAHFENRECKSAKKILFGFGAQLFCPFVVLFIVRTDTFIFIYYAGRTCN